VTERYSLLEALGIDPAGPDSVTKGLLESHGIQVPDPGETHSADDRPSRSVEPASRAAVQTPLREGLQRDDLELERWREMAGLNGKGHRR
jgi:hypothetical protein